MVRLYRTYRTAQYYRSCQLLLLDVVLMPIVLLYTATSAYFRHSVPHHCIPLLAATRLACVQPAFPTTKDRRGSYFR